MKKSIIYIFLVICFSQQIFSQNETILLESNSIDLVTHDHAGCASHVSSTAPIGVMRDHVHNKGNWMVSYRFMQMNMDGMILQSNSTDNQEIFSEYMVSPQSMKMSMHMLGLMYSVSDNVTLALMANVRSNAMNLKTRMDMNFETKSSGLGDLNLSVVANLVQSNQFSLISTFGVSAPAGSINQSAKTPMNENMVLAYPMQLGSGTWDPFLGTTLLVNKRKMSWGAQAFYKFRAGRNAREYTLGNELRSTIWTTFIASDLFNTSLRANFISLGKISGVDERFSPAMMPLFNVQNSGKTNVDLLVGANYHLKNILPGCKIGIEVGKSIFQYVEGFQMKNNFVANVGVQFTF